MGLDIVELIMMVEEAFAIKIEDRDAESLVTVGQLHDYIVKKLPPTSRFRITKAGVPRETAPCLTAVSFFRLRRVTAELQGIDKKAIRTSTPLQAVLPPSERLALWPRLQQNLAIRLPALRRPDWLNRLNWVWLPLILWICVTCISFALFPAPRNVDDKILAARLFAGVPAALFLGGVLHYVTRTRATQLRHVSTFGDLARLTLALNFCQLSHELSPDRQETVWEHLAGIVSQWSGMDAARIGPESDFVRDLLPG